MSLEVEGTFVSQKINKIRWIPEDYVETKHFFTGSWDDDENFIKVWLFEHINEDDHVEYPRQLSEYKVAGDVTEIKFLDKNKIAVSISNGEVRILEISAYERQAPLKEVFEWKQLHKIEHDPCSCTSLDTFEGDIASAGEDGKVNILNGRRGDITSTLYHSADSCSLHSVCFIKSNEVITGNIRGHMKIWDIRSDNQKPAASFVLSTDELAATCIVQHPTQPHIVLAGSESGFIAVWDLRINQFPTTLVNAHSAGVTEMQFHPENPYRLLTSSVSGDIWDWDMELLTKKTPDSYLPIDEKTTMNVNSIITMRKSVNTIHCDKGRILCGCDNEAIYLIKNFKF